jgi:RNA polymerase sigma-70 factor (ECF subfamily)
MSVEENTVIDEAFFNQKIAECLPKIKRQAFFLTKEREAGNDLIQDTVLRVLEKRHKYREDRNFDSWVLLIMRNLFVDKYRNNKLIKHPHVSTDENEVNDFFSQSNCYYTYDFDKYMDVVNGLDKELSEPLFLLVDGYKYREISIKLSISEGTVKNRLHRARVTIETTLNQKLRKQGKKAK